MCPKTRSSLRMRALWKTSFSTSCVSNSRWKTSQTSPGPFIRCAASCGACGVKLVVCLALTLRCSKYHRQHQQPLVRWIYSLAFAAKALRLRIATSCGETSRRNAQEHWWHWTPCLPCPCWTWFKHRNCKVLMIGSRGKSSWVKRPLRLWRGASPWMLKTDLLKHLPLVSACVMKSGTGRSRRPRIACTSCCRCAPNVMPWWVLVILAIGPCMLRSLWNSTLWNPEPTAGTQTFKKLKMQIRLLCAKSSGCAMEEPRWMMPWLQWQLTGICCDSCSNRGRNCCRLQRGTVSLWNGRRGQSRRLPLEQVWVNVFCGGVGNAIVPTASSTTRAAIVALPTTVQRSVSAIKRRKPECLGRRWND